MSDYVITIPEALYDKARRLAETRSESVDEVIRVRLEHALDDPRLALPADERAELEALRYLSDDALWTIAREQMTETKQTRMQMLMDRNTMGTISPAETGELAQLVELGQRLTLRKAEAMKLLIQRGHRVTLDDLALTNE
jgi:hypothetical protein